MYKEISRKGPKRPNTRFCALAIHYQDTRTQNVVVQAVSIFSVKQIDGNLPQKSILIVNQGQQTPHKKHYKSLKEVDRNAITETSCSGHWWRHNGHRQQHQQSKLDYATLSKIRNECTTFFYCKRGLSLGGHIHMVCFSLFKLYLAVLILLWRLY